MDLLVETGDRIDVEQHFSIDDEVSLPIAAKIEVPAAENGQHLATATFQDRGKRPGRLVDPDDAERSVLRRLDRAGRSVASLRVHRHLLPRRRELRRAASGQRQRCLREPLKLRQRRVRGRRDVRELRRRLQLRVR